MFSIKQNLVRALVSTALFTIPLCLGLAPSVSASDIDLGGTADYAVVGVGGTVNIQSDFQIYQSATVINGNVAEGPYTTLTHAIDATVNGRWDYDTTDATPTLGSGGVVTGGFHQMNLAPVSADARAAALQGSLLVPTQTYMSLDQFDGVGSINGNGGLNVINITSTSALKISLTLQGTASDRFVFQFTDSTTTAGHDVLSLSGMTMNIGSINPNNIYWVFKGDGGDLNINAMADNQTVYGNFIAPDRNITVDHGNVVGRLIGGGSLYGQRLLSIHSGSTVTVPQVPDGGSTLALLGMALVGLGLVRFRKTKG